MNDCCCESVNSANTCGNSCGSCGFDSDMILWVLIIIVIVSCCK